MDVRVNSDGVDINCKYASLYQVNKKLEFINYI